MARLIGSPPGYGATAKADSSPRPYGASPTRSYCSTRSRRRTQRLQHHAAGFRRGHLTDGTGRTVDFRNTVIIMTSNVGSRAATENAHPVGYNTPSKNTGAAAAPEAEYRKALERHLRTGVPQPHRRHNIYFRTLTIDDVERIVDLQLEGRFLAHPPPWLRRDHNPESASGWQMGYEARYGAGTAAHAARRGGGPIASLIIDGKLRAGGSVTVDLSDNRSLTLRVA